RARVSGELVKIHFTDGQTVKAGDILFTIDPRPFEIAVEAARAEVARARAQIAVTGNDLERAEQLTPSKVLTQRDFDQRKANHDAAKAQLQSAEAMLRNAELNLEWTSVLAPIDGRISDRKVDAGNLVSGGQVAASLLTTIVSLHPIHFVFNVSEPEYVRYSRLAANGQRLSSSVPGNVVQIRLADEKKWIRNGRMNFIDNQLNGKSGTIRARALVDNEDFFLTPGTFGRLRLFGGNFEALLIPDAAVTSDQSRKVVYTVGPAHFLIERPVFATVLSLILTIAGAIAQQSLPISEYPEIVPPTVNIKATYPGASAEVIAETVAAPIEQEVNGVDDMLYISSQSTGDGQLSINVVFKPGVNIDQAQVLVQNRLAVVQPRLPDEVTRFGITVRKSSPDLMMVVHMTSPDGSRDQQYVANYASLYIKDALLRIEGVGDVLVFGARDYSMRVWLDPAKVAERGLTAGEVVTALRAANFQVAAGAINQPPARSP